MECGDGKEIRSSRILNWRLIYRVFISNPSNLSVPESTGRHKNTLSMPETLGTKFEAELSGKNPPNEIAGDLQNKILEIVVIKILVEHSSLNTTMLTAHLT